MPSSNWNKMKIFFIGFMGSGKTYTGQLVSQKLQLPFFDLDEQIINQEGKSINQIFEEDGEEHFRQVEKEVLHILTESHEAFVMATGGGTPCYFNNIGYMKDAGVTVWVNTSQDVLFNRLVSEKSHRPLLKDLSDDQLRGYIQKKFSDRRIYYEQADVTFREEENEKLDQLLQKIMHV